MTAVFDLIPKENNIEASLAYLIAARDYIAQQTAPSNYIQIPHSGDPNPVGGDKKRPAMLDASYEHFERLRLSISFPLFMPQDKAYEINPNPRPGEPVLTYLPGFNNIVLQTSFLQLLKSQNINYDLNSSKCGYYVPNGTQYIEVIVKPSDYERGRKLIQQLVHGNPTTDLELHRLIEPALKAERAAQEKQKKGFVKGLWSKASSFAKRSSHLVYFRPASKTAKKLQRKAEP